MREATATIAQSYLVDETGPVADSTNQIKKILDAKYEAADIPTIVESCTHLTDLEKSKLAKLLLKYEELFDGTLGKWKGPPVDIQLRENVKPYHARAYPIPKSQEAKIRAEIYKLIEARVLKKVNRSEWAAPNFVIPKKDETIRFISDFR